jgi:hypothetical protein
MEKIVPAVSSSAVGPLGITHLPRLYAKAILNATGSLAEGYNSGNRGMDKWVLDDLAIEHEPFFAFLDTLPSYSATESWVRANAGKVDDASIAAHNERVRSFDMPDETQQRMRSAIGSTDASLRKGYLLNDLDDWTSLHAFVTAKRGTKLEPIVPLVSMQCAGPLGAKHLPRLWAKGIIHGAGALPDGWRSGPVRVVYTDGVPALVEAAGGIDAMTLENLGLDMHETCQFLLAKAPSYLEFEHWVRANGKNVDPQSVAAHNAGPWVAKGERAAAELERLGFSGMSECDMFLYNDLGDWDALVAQARKRRASSAA